MRESISPRSTITLAGSYRFSDFLDNTNTVNATNTGTVNSHQISGSAGYNRILNRFDQVGVSYGYQQFQFPMQGAGSIQSNVFQFLYAHQVSGRMSLILGAGPQITTVGERNGLPAFSQVSANIRTSLHYRYPKTLLMLGYDRYTSGGSGLQLGSHSDVVKAAIQRPLSRLWTSSLDVGYSRHTALQDPGLTSNALGGSFQDGYGGGGLTRRLGRFFSLALHYQYNYEYFGGAACTGGKIDCSHSFNRHVGDVTLSWHPLPIRLD